MIKFLYLFLFILFFGIFFSCSSDHKVINEPIIHLRYTEDYTPSYDELIAYYKKLDDFSDQTKLIRVGETDAGRPLHLFVIDRDGDFDPISIREKGKTILFINNGIHPGEPCGIDGSLLFIDELLRNVDQLKNILRNTTICIVPVYNVGGHLNRSAYNRANQMGPIETGFRGNARNLDLNRDFIKCDSKNAQTFNELFTTWDPDVFLDTHTTNGSDHQYCITLIPTNPSALPGPMDQFLRGIMLPDLYRSMLETPYEMTPYVVWSNQNPGEGITMTFESGRYSTGYSRLNYTYGFMTENHVYKSYTDRVQSIFHFIKKLSVFTAEHSKEILESRASAIQEALAAKTYHLDYAVDTTQFEQLNFKGYESGVMKSQLTGLDRFAYDRSQPFERTIKYYTTFHPVLSVVKPQYYILPSAWTEAVDRMKMNGVQMTKFPEDEKLTVDAYFITRLSNPASPYNGHFFHDTVEVVMRPTEIQVYKNDYLIPVNQKKMAYIMECLEPKASDSFLRWNFFDSMLDRREYFSPWGFEGNAQKYLDEHPEFKAKWEEERTNNTAIKTSHYQQMQYIYSHSEWSEKSFLRYPVYRVENVTFSWAE
ncbi:MAG: M14 family zinc carboxypeptidase [Prolixibacteraceae bacterium]